MILGRDTCGEWPGAAGHEWLVTNGLGGYACGTVALANTRRYHAFLMASLDPPVARTLLVAKVEVSVAYRGARFALTSNEYADGTVDPNGFVHIESFTLIEGIPTWRYALADALIEQRIFMAPDTHASYLELTVLRASAPLGVAFKPLVSYRDFHDSGHGARPFALEVADAGGARVTVQAFADARPYDLFVEGARFTRLDTWYWNFRHREEAARGLDALEDLYVPGVFTASLSMTAPCVFCASLERESPAPAAVRTALELGARRVKASLPESAPAWIGSLALAAQQFIVRRKAAGTFSVIAGYPWFADWGRDTMIALPGLATALGHHDTAADILRTWLEFVDRGMLPNRFPDGGGAPEYNTADATLWLFHALDEALTAHPDPALARDAFPVLLSIIRAHVAGTRHGIGVDPADGLLRAGESGFALTWMDAKHGDEVFTPRRGKPVEINALWVNALEVTGRLAGELGASADARTCRHLLTQARLGFERFWNAGRGCLYDVIDVEGGGEVDARVRPNQLIAAALPAVQLAPERLRAVLAVCSEELLTSHGLRSLSPREPGYLGRYQGDPRARDAAYHQGTVWSWLLGPYVRVHYRVHGDARLARSFLDPMAQHVAAACMGSISEIFDGDAPHTARGCFAQAWSVAEILRSWLYLERRISDL